MSYSLPILIFSIILSPLVIPIGVTVVHAIRTWRPQLRVPMPVLPRQRRRLQLAVELD